MFTSAFVPALSLKKPGGRYTNKYKNKFRLKIMLNKMKLSRPKQYFLYKTILYLRC